MELTAYVENSEAGFLALRSGADSICAKINLNHSSFTLKELSSLSLYAHRHNKRIFVSLDFMVKETEWSKTIDVIIALNEIKPDAFIIQDLGVYYLLKHKFPHFNLCGSRLMNIHNVSGAKQLEKMGFKRVALAPELNLREIEEIKREVSIELEVLVHGRLHFSQPGLCLFSSFLCGKSNMRGHCQRPCHLPYEISGKIEHFFHCKWLCAISLIPQLRLIGIDAVGVEAKKDIAKVVEAYRLVIDAKGKEVITAINHAKSLLGKEDNFTTGFFISPKAKEILATYGPETEVYLEQVQKREGENIYFSSKEEVRIGDLISAYDEAFNKIVWKVKKINEEKHFLSVNAPDEVQVGYLLFKLKNKKLDKIEKKHLLDKIVFKNKRKKNQLLDWIETQTISKKYIKTKEFWIHSETLDIFEFPHFPFVPILTINDRNYSYLLRRYRQILKRFPNLALSLPSIIFPSQLNFFKKAINQLVNLGFKRWSVANLGQFSLFQEKQRIFLSTDYTFNVANTLSIRVLKELGAEIVTLSVELDKSSIRELPETMALVYGRIPVLTSCLKVEDFKGGSILSPLGIEYLIVSRNQITYILPQLPFSLTDSLEELKSFGIHRFLLDLRFMLTKEGARILGRDKAALPRGFKLNYQRGLI